MILSSYYTKSKVIIFGMYTILLNCLAFCIKNIPLKLKVGNFPENSVFEKNIIARVYRSVIGLHYI